MSAVTTNTTTPPIRGGPFTINLLNTILAFAASDERDVFLCYTLVCKQWREAEMYYCQEMWRNLALKLFHGNLPRSSVWSHWAYIRRRRANVNFTKDLVYSGEMDEIEDCGLGHKNNNEDAAAVGDRPDFSFRCPLLSRHLRMLENEVVPGNSDRNVLFCDVCEKRVYPIKNRSDMKNLPRDEGGHVCVVMKKNSVYDNINKYLSSSGQKLGTDIYNDRGDEGPFNVALVTTEPAAPPEGYDLFHGLSNSGRLGLGEQIVTQLVHSADASTVRLTTEELGGEPCDDNDENDGNDDAAAGNEKKDQKKKKKKSVVIGHSILSKELLLCSIADFAAVHVRIVRIPPPPADLNAETAKTKYASLHPAHPDNVLGKNKMPTKNGWNLMLGVTDDVKRWFEKDVFPQGSRALLTTFHMTYENKNFLNSTNTKSKQETELVDTKLFRREIPFDRNPKIPAKLSQASATQEGGLENLKQALQRKSMIDSAVSIIINAAVEFAYNDEEMGDECEPSFGTEDGTESD